MQLDSCSIRGWDDAELLPSSTRHNQTFFAAAEITMSLWRWPSEERTRHELKYPSRHQPKKKDWLLSSWFSPWCFPSCDLSSQALLGRVPELLSMPLIPFTFTLRKLEVTDAEATTLGYSIKGAATLGKATFVKFRFSRCSSLSWWYWGSAYSVFSLFCLF